MNINMIDFLPVGRHYYLFGFKLPIFATLFIVAIILSSYVYVKQAEKHKVNCCYAIKAAMHFVFWMFLGFHLFHYIFVQKCSSCIMKIQGNDSIGVVFGFIALLIYLKLNKQSFGKFFDVLVFPMLIASTLLRLSDMLTGDKIGTLTEVSWSIAQRHPIGLYYFVVSLLILLIVWRLNQKKMKSGNLFLITVMIYSFSRVILDIFRAVPPHEYAGLSIHQIAWGLLFIISTIISTIIYLWNNKGK